MDVTKNNSSSSKLINVMIKDCPTSFNLNTDISHNENHYLILYQIKKLN